MKAFLKEDIILHITANGDTEIGDLVPKVGLERQRFDGTEMVDLINLDEMWVRHKGGDAFELHAVQVPNSQLVQMNYLDRKWLTKDDDGIIRVLTPLEREAKLESAYNRSSVSVRFNEIKKLDNFINGVLHATPETINQYIENNVTNLDSAKEVLKRMALLIAYCMRKLEK